MKLQHAPCYRFISNDSAHVTCVEMLSALRVSDTPMRNILRMVVEVEEAGTTAAGREKACDSNRKRKRVCSNAGTQL